LAAARRQWTYRKKGWEREARQWQGGEVEAAAGLASNRKTVAKFGAARLNWEVYPFITN
jgi:hypothetical protein